MVTMVLLMIDVINKAGALYASEGRPTDMKGDTERERETERGREKSTAAIYLLTALGQTALIR